MRQRMLGLFVMLCLPTLVGAQSRVTQFSDAVTTGARKVQIRNTTAGTSNTSELEIGNDATAALVALRGYSSTHASAASFGILSSTGSGGLIVRTDNAASLFLGTNATSRMFITAAGSVGVGGTSDQYQFYQAGTFTPASAATAAANRVDTTVVGQINNNVFGTIISPTLVEASSGTHGILASTIINPPTVTGGSASVTTAATLYVNGGASASGAANYALFVNGGQSAFNDGTAGAPAITFSSDPDTGLMLDTAPAGVAVTIGGTKNYRLSHQVLYLLDLALGTGGNAGRYLDIGRNTSGNGAPGFVTFRDKAGSGQNVWVDSTGVVRTGTSQPTEFAGDTGGAIVGEQPSTWESKDILGRETDGAGALAELLQTPVYRFSYRSGAYNGQQFVGITTRTSPLFGMDQGRSFNPVTAFGVTVLAMQELERRVRALEAQR